jgi:hypothetical protein
MDHLNTHHITSLLILWFLPEILLVGILYAPIQFLDLLLNSFPRFFVLVPSYNIHLGVLDAAHEDQPAYLIKELPSELVKVKEK